VSNLVLNGTTTVCGISVPNIEGGFGEGKKAMLVKDIASLHGFETKKVNQDINRNRNRFKDGIDIIDLKGTEFVVTLSDHGILNQNTVNRANHIYALSERGYSKLLKIFDDDLAWEKYDEVMDEYFALRSQVNVPMATDQLEVAAIMIQELKSQRDRISAVEGTVQAVKDVFVSEEENWREMIRRNIDKIVVTANSDHQTVYNESYELLDKQGFDINKRLKNRRNRMLKQGATRTAIKKVSKLDIIEDDPKSKGLYTGIVRGMVLKYVV